MNTPNQQATALATAVIEAAKGGKPLPSGIVKKNTSYNADPRRICLREGWNNRFDLGDIETLAQGIKTTAARTPDRPYATDMEVKRLLPSDPRSADFDFEVVTGHRRYEATQLLLKQGVEFPQGINIRLVDRSTSDLDNTILLFTENNQKPLLPLEEAAAYKRLRDGGLTIMGIAKAVGRTDVHVMDTLALLEADDSVKDAVKTGVVGATVAKQIAQVAKGNKDKQRELIADAKAAGKDKTKKREVAAKIEAARQSNAAAKGKTLKVKPLTADALNALGAKVAKHAGALAREAGFTDLFKTPEAFIDHVAKDEKMAAAYMLGAVMALRAAAGEKNVKLDL